MKRIHATTVVGFILVLAPLTADASQCPAISVSLSPGQSGVAVAELQTFLIGLGQLEPGSSTGYYGPLTTAAVQRFQCLQDIVCSGTPQSTGWGTVGMKTRTSISATCTDPKVLGISTNALTTVASAGTSISSSTGAPEITWTQTLATTTSDGTTGQSFTISWSATGATSCVLQKTTPEGLLTNPWASGVSGSKAASPFKIGMHHFWIDCMGPGGATRQDMYHTVTSATASAADAYKNLASALQAFLSLSR